MFKGYNVGLIHYSILKPQVLKITIEVLTSLVICKSYFQGRQGFDSLTSRQTGAQPDIRLPDLTSGRRSA
ncbi:hypothetical protein SAMN04488519_108167 [Algoriphagus ornithinivorans]|uniref:Uncharacterized protein n=1 Tax=Algoriphagus ornithinivorans TaxID=226506 RepID=A0A1I5I9G8_9BACT|nr:hypothetical protein SAMN04488519_108167 [Algoriphagus ornithinivorans]